MKRQLLTLTTCVLLAGCQSGNVEEGGAWSYSEHLDKLTGNKTFTAEAHLTDKEVPLVMTEVILKCDPKQPGSSIFPKGAISIEFKTLKSLPTGKSSQTGEEFFDGMPMVSMEDLSLRVPVRADTDPPRNSIVTLDKYNNAFSLALRDVGEIDELSKKAFFGVVIGVVFISPSTQKEIVVRIPTEQGSPTLSIPLQNSSVKKVASQCGWNLGQQVATATSSTSNSQHSSLSTSEAQAATASPADKQIVGRWYRERSELGGGEGVRVEAKEFSVEEYFANGSTNSESQMITTVNYDAGVAAFKKMEVSFDLKTATEWKIKDDSLDENRVSFNLVPGYIKVDDVVLEDEAKKAQIFKHFMSPFEEQYAKNKTGQRKIVSIGKDKFVYEIKEEDSKVTRISATRTDKDFSAMRVETAAQTPNHADNTVATEQKLNANTPSPKQHSADVVTPGRVETAAQAPNHADNAVVTEQKLSANTHCKTDEATLFTGMFGKKVLSFCATPAKMPYERIEYRYGIVGKVDMTYTATTTGDGPKLFYDNVIGATNDHGSSTNIMWFQKGTYIYALLECRGSSCNSSERPSLVVLNGKKKLMESKCQGELACDFKLPIANNGDRPKSLSPILLVKEAPYDQLGL